MLTLGMALLISGGAAQASDFHGKSMEGRDVHSKAFGSGTAYAPPGGVWGPDSIDGAYTGGTGLTYCYKNNGNVPGSVGIQAKGLNPEGIPTWYGLPAIGQAGAGEGVVPWVDNSMAAPGLRATSLSINGTTVNWSAGCV